MNGQETWLSSDLHEDAFTQFLEDKEISEISYNTSLFRSFLIGRPHTEKVLKMFPPQNSRF
jgi:hypothetical protein